MQSRARAKASRLGSSALLCAAFCLSVSPSAQAQAQANATAGAPAQGGFPDATFGVMFRKYTPPDNVFSPYYSWDAEMALDLTVSRVGRNTMTVVAVFQTVGTADIGSRVAVGGTGYVIRPSYVHAFSDDASVSAGVSHLSSHLTRDLDEKTSDQRAMGAAVPQVPDSQEYNAVFVRARRRFATRRFTPELDVVIQPENFRFTGGPAAYLRPLYIATRWRLWTRGQTSLSAETQHEIGKRSWNYGALFLELYTRNQTDGRFQLFVSASPGHSLHTSPDIGGLRDGVAAGVRMVFRSTTR